MNMLGIGKIDDLHKEYELQKREVYIKNTSNAICKLGYIAEKLESAYETKYRLDPSYKNEERMRYWRYIKEELAQRWILQGQRICVAEGRGHQR